MKTSKTRKTLTKKNITKKNITKKNSSRKKRKTYLVLQYDNRKITKQYDILTKINQKYCSLYGYDYILNTKEYNLPPYWIKVKLVMDLLNTNRYKGILWLDTDAVIDNFAISLESICVKNKSMYYSYELIEEDTRNIYSHLFNAGVWFILNDATGKQIMNDWYKLYNPNKWRNIKNKWLWADKKKNRRNGWAGIDFEQGSFNKAIIPKYKNNCYQYYWNFFQSTNINAVSTDKPTFTYHFYGNNKIANLPSYLKSRALTIKSAT